jgi:excinuclease ABC subunit A
LTIMGIFIHGKTMDLKSVSAQNARNQADFEIVNYNTDEYLKDESFFPNPHNYITVRGARQHNLKNVSVIVPKNKLVVFSGLSGSGKSSLVFDTIYAEGQRRYVESLSSYARQFLGLKEKPDVDYIEGLSPAISIDQKSTSRNPRSTVGTTTEIYDYLRLLFAKIGNQLDPETGLELRVESMTGMADRLFKAAKGQSAIFLAPVVDDKKGWHRQAVSEAKKSGFRRIRVDGKIMLIDEAEKVELEKTLKHSIEIIVDKQVIEDENRLRIIDSLETSLKLGKDKAFVIISDGEHERVLDFSKNKLKELEPRMFSFNSPHGACAHCSGLGYLTEVDADLVVPNPNLSILEGAIRPFSKMTVSGGWMTKLLEALATRYSFKMTEAWKKISDKAKHAILFGDDKFEGVITNLQRRYKDSASDSSRRDIESYMSKKSCNVCNGAKLNEHSLAVKVSGKNIAQVSDLSIQDCLTFFETLRDGETLVQKQKEISKMILKEVISRLMFLQNVGLEYLSLSRSANTLSGGEAQRIRLATQIGSGLTGVLYILDEPSIGLHQRDNTKLLGTLKNLRNLGNTVLVVEHDEETMREADFLVDIGPAAGKHGGHVVAAGTPKEVEGIQDSPTGRFLAGLEHIEVPKKRRPVLPMKDDYSHKRDNKEMAEAKKYGKYISILGAEENNLKNVSVDFPLGRMVCITGVSGSGKSTLINQIFSNELMNYFYDSRLDTGNFDEIKGLDNIDKPIIIDQSAIGRTPRSNPATYTGLFTPIRDLFTSLPESKARGYGPGRFSFNVEGGRCETCKGEGMIKVEMNFLPDVYIVCEDCQGQRYNRETLEVKYKEKSIAEILDMTVEAAGEFFKHNKIINRKLETLLEVGLGYIHLGQSATTLSGGEAQRVKLATELSKVGTGNTMYILDEPTTGLHPIDVKKLLVVLQKLVDKGNTVIIIEHNLDIIKSADWLIDLGPEGGDKGGKVVGVGTPEELIKIKESYTGMYLKNVL